jgi:hypothetical protein
MSDFNFYFDQLTVHAPELVPSGVADEKLSRQLKSADLFDGRSGPMVECCRAGLLLCNDDLNAAHPLVQDLEDNTAAFWHAIIHRREGDFSNARYWWARTGDHPAFEPIYDLVLHRVPDFALLDELRAAGHWLPLEMNAACQNFTSDGRFESELRATQRLEMRGLLEWCAARVRAGH